MRTFALKVYHATAVVAIRQTERLGSNFGLTKKVRHGEFKVWIRPHMSDKDTLDTAIHEALHVADWTKEEEWVHTTASGIASMLWDMGYRRDPAKMRSR